MALRKLTRVVWRRYRSSKALVDKWNADAKDLPTTNPIGSSGLKGIQRRGMWAFVVREPKKIPVVHYWHDGRRSLVELTFMLGHELGHVSGKKSMDWMWDGGDAESAEEARANEYGRVAALVVKHVFKRRGKLPIESEWY